MRILSTEGLQGVIIPAVKTYITWNKMKIKTNTKII